MGFCVKTPLNWKDHSHCQILIYVNFPKHFWKTKQWHQLKRFRRKCYCCMDHVHISSPWRATFLDCTEVNLQDDGHVTNRRGQASTGELLLLPYSAWFAWLGLRSLPLSRRTQEESRASKTGGSPGLPACSVPSCSLSQLPTWSPFFVWLARLVLSTHSSLIHLQYWLHWYFTHRFVYVNSLLW